MKFKILRNIPEIFEVEADSFEEAIQKIENGEAGESVWNSDTYELIEEIHETIQS